MNQPSQKNEQFVCDLQRAKQFLEADHYRLEDEELVAHLDSCADCREYLETQAAGIETWNQAADLLKPGEFDSAGVADYSAATVIGNFEQQPVAIQDVLDSLTPSEDPHRLGRLGNYEVTGVVGVGGMGVVLKAVDPSLDRVVAVKVMAPRLANNEKARKRFSREAKAAAAVLHPNVIPIHSVSSGGSIPYLVMAYVRGGSLQKRLDNEGPLQVVEILRIGSQIAAGLSAAHEQGLVHRDIKPENILLEEGVERVTLTDFGLARAVDDNTVTQNGAIAGTPMYMSPEQARGDKVDQQSDLFSLGSVMYALCTGRPPYTGDTSFGVMRRIIDETPVPIRELNPEIPDWLAGIVERLMAKEKGERFESAAEVHRLMDECLSHVQQPDAIPMPEECRDLASRPKPVVAGSSPEPAAGRRGGRLKRWLTGLLCGGLIAVAFFMYGTTERDAKADYFKLGAYLATGESVEDSGDIVDRLLCSASGRNYLKRLDNEFVEISYVEGDFSHGVKSIVALLHHDRNQGILRELSIRTSRNDDIEGRTYPPVVEFPVTGVQFVNDDAHPNLSISFRTRKEVSLKKQIESHGLKPNRNYSLSIPVAELIEGDLDWLSVWSRGKAIDEVSGNADTSTARPGVEVASYRDETQAGSGHRWKLLTQKVSKVRIRLLHITKGEVHVASESQLRSSGQKETKIDLALELEPAADDRNTVSPIISVSADGLQVNRSTGTPVTVSGPFQVSPVVNGGGLAWDKETILFHRCIWEGDLTYGRTVESMTEASKQGADFVALTVEWVAVGTIKLPKWAEPQQVVNDDLGNIQGTWRVVFSEDNGRAAPQEALRNIRAVFTKDTMTMELGGRTSESTYKLDPSTNPSSIDLTENGRTIFGIYDLQGDTLRVCFAEHTDERPTAFDSQPDSVNDVVLIMKRMKPEELAAEKTTTADHEGPCTPELARSLLPKAASISNDDLQKLSANPRPDVIVNQSLSLTLMTLDVRKDKPGFEKDFQFAFDGVPRMSELMNPMLISQSKGFASMIQPEYIVDCQCGPLQGEQNQAIGRVSFKSPVYKGEVKFRAEKRDGKWQITRFDLPNRRITIVLGEDGNWKRVNPGEKEASPTTE